jgi:multidrug transporter EmrE-like cation transporter
MIYSLILVFLAVLLTGISQVLLKIGSAHNGKRKDSVLDAYLNLHTFCAYGILLIVTVISVIALKEIPLKVFYAIASLGFVVVLIFSWGLLGERITKKTIMGILLIMVGICVFNLL